MKLYRHLSLTEREEFSRGLASNFSFREIAKTLGRSASSLSREMKRQGRTRRSYRAVIAQKQSQRRIKEPRKKRKLGLF